MKQHESGFLNLVNEAKQRIQEINPQQLKEKLEKKEALCLIDVREDREWVSGHIPNAIHLSKGVIERDIEKKIPNHQTQIVVYCSGGFRCALVAENLQKMGYSNVYSLDTGMQGWQNAGFEIKDNHDSQ